MNLCSGPPTFAAHAPFRAPPPRAPPPLSCGLTVSPSGARRRRCGAPPGTPPPGATVSPMSLSFTKAPAVSRAPVRRDGRRGRAEDVGGGGGGVWAGRPGPRAWGMPPCPVPRPPLFLRPAAPVGSGLQGRPLPPLSATGNPPATHIGPPVILLTTFSARRSSTAARRDQGAKRQRLPHSSAQTTRRRRPAALVIPQSYRPTPPSVPHPIPSFLPHPTPALSSSPPPGFTP